MRLGASVPSDFEDDVVATELSASLGARRRCRLADEAPPPEPQREALRKGWRLDTAAAPSPNNEGVAAAASPPEGVAVAAGAASPSEGVAAAALGVT